MLSGRKSFLRVLEWAVCVMLACSLTALAGIALHWLEPRFVESLVIPAFLAAFLEMTVAMGLLVEHLLSSARARAPARRSSSEWTLGEFKPLLKWCPMSIWPLWALGLPTLGWTLGGIGSVQWASSQPLGQREALGILSMISFFLLLPWPALASISRMPGAFRDQPPKRL